MTQSIDRAPARATDSIEDRFWSTASCLATHAPAERKYAVYNQIQRLYRAQYPNANHVEHQQAMARIARLCRV